MQRVKTLLSAAVIAAVSVIAEPAARAAVDVNLGVSTTVGDTDLFFSISSRYFDREPPVVRDWSRRFRNPDDLAVFFFIVRNSRMSPDQVYSLRRSGMRWYDVGQRAGISYREWFVRYDGPPQGRYAKPYGHYKKHRKNPKYSMQLSDREIRDLVALRMAHEYYGVDCQTAMDWRRSGSSVQVIMSREYRHRHHDRKHDRRDDDDDDDDGWHDGDRHHDRDGYHRDEHRRNDR